MKLNQLTVAILAAGFAAQASAAGFALSEQSVSANGTANAGRASDAVDASVVYNNPAAMHKLKQAQITTNVSFIDADTKIKNQVVAGGATAGGNSKGDIVPHSFIPSGFFTSGDQGGWAYGIGAYGSFGLKTNHDDGFAGRYLGNKSDVKVTTIQPAVSYKVHDKVSVGAGITINQIEAYLSSNPGDALGLTGNNGRVQIEGDDVGYGFNLALHSDITESTQVGLIYRSKVKYKIDDGEIRVGAGLIGLTGGESKSNAKTGISTPESVELAITHAISSKTKLHATTSWTRWSRLKSLDVSTGFPTNPVPPFPASFDQVSEEFNWKDSMAYAVGVSHALDDKLTVRAGLAYDNTPVAPADRGVRLPSGDRRVASVGAGYALTPNQVVDVSYMYIDEERADVNRPADGYAATFQNSASIYGVQYTLKF